MVRAGRRLTGPASPRGLLRRRGALVSRFWLLALLVAACDCGPAGDDSGTTSQPLSGTPATRLLDRSDDGRRELLGTPLPAPEDADALLVHQVEYRVDGRVQPWPHPVPIQDARFLPDGTVAAVDAEAKLVIVNPATAEVQLLAEEVSAGLDASAACGCLVSLTGGYPAGTLTVRELKTREVRLAHDGFAPAWSPVLSPKGDSLVVVSSRSGLPALWLVPLDGSPPRILTNAAADPARPDDLVPFPEEPDRPVWTGDLLVFRTRGAVHAIGLDGRVRWSRPALGVPRLNPGGESISFGSRQFPVRELLRDGGPR